MLFRHQAIGGFKVVSTVSSSKACRVLLRRGAGDGGAVWAGAVRALHPAGGAAAHAEAQGRAAERG